MLKKGIQMGLVVLLIACVAMIFLFSSQTSRDSGNLSKGVTKEILTVVYPSFSELDAVQQQTCVNAVFLKVRKLAHFFLFAVLGMISVSAMVLWRHPWKKGIVWDIWLALVFCFLYACTDELHQMFVPGRGAQLRDVMLDTAGAFCGILFASIIILAVKRAVGRSMAQRER